MSTINIAGQLVCYHWSWMEPGAVHWAFEPGKNRTGPTKDVLAIIPHIFTAEVPEIIVEEAQAAARIAALEAEKIQAGETHKRTVADIDNRLRLLRAEGGAS